MLKVCTTPLQFQNPRPNAEGSWDFERRYLAIVPDSDIQGKTKTITLSQEEFNEVTGSKG